MNPGIVVVAGLAGIVILSKTDLLGKVTAKEVSSQPPPTNNWPSWLNLGSQPATGQGQNPIETVGSVADAVGELAKLGTSLANYFGRSTSTQQMTGAGGSAGSIVQFGDNT